MGAGMERAARVEDTSSDVAPIRQAAKGRIRHLQVGQES